MLRENPDMVVSVANTLDFEHKCGLVLIPWAPDDRAAGEQIEPVLDKFGKTAWADLVSCHASNVG